ncbi:TRM11 family SAM-dependent methyltransferase [Actinosynnema sp. CA-248983]
MRAVRLVARTVRGVESVAAQEIAGVGVVESLGHREVWFSAVPGPAVLRLRCVDDVFLVAAVVSGIGRSRADLRLLTAAMASVDVRGVVGLSGEFGVRRVWSTVDVSGSFLGRRNFTRYDVEDAVGEPVAAALGVAYHGRRGGRVPPAGGLPWRVMVDGDRAVVGLRVAAKPLHRRGYRRVSRPGALHPPVAAAMVRLAGSGQRVVDPFCGTGTIAIEAALLGATVLGVDVEPAAVAAGVVNTPGWLAGRVGWAVGDAGRLPVASGSVDLVVGNPPWGGRWRRSVRSIGSGGRFCGCSGPVGGRCC